MLKIGDKLPKFKLPDQDGNMISSTDLKGKNVVLVFYPRDLTPTCTVQVCNLRDNYAELVKNGYTIIGVSADEISKHKRFSERNALPFPLISDVDRKLIEAMGVWGEKKFMGRIITGIYRTTFIINTKGIISHIFDKPKSKVHSAQILGQI